MKQLRHLLYFFVCFTVLTSLVSCQSESADPTREIDISSRGNGQFFDGEKTEQTTNIQIIDNSPDPTPVSPTPVPPTPVPPTPVPPTPVLSNLEVARITCNGAPPTRLNIGFRARVTYTDGTPGSVRPAPASGQIYGKVPEGVGMDIIGGPRCDNKRVWWQVTTDNGYKGWISEGKPGEYWLQPTN